MLPKRLIGKVALVCNASSSLGYAIARRLGLSGAHVYLSDPDETGLNYALDGLRGAEINASIVPADLLIAEQRNKLFDQIKNEAGMLHATVICPKPNQVKGDIINSSAEEFDQIFSKYLTLPFLTCKSAIPLMEASTPSSIVLITSMTGYTPFVDVGLYSAAQTGVLGLCKSLAQSLAKRNIRVNSVCLGMFDDDGSGASWSSCSGAATSASMTNAQADAIRKNLASFIPLGRTGRGKDCAGFVEFLCSDMSSYVTGENFPVTGGITVKL